MARAAFAVPDGAQPGDVVPLPWLGVCLGHVKLPVGTFGGQWLTGTCTVCTVRYRACWAIQGVTLTVFCH